jgi:cyclopropane-fatty-acyl-phospholipid synthase
MADARSTTLALLDDLFGSPPRREFAVRLWDGSLWGGEADEEPRSTIVLRHPGAVRAMFWPPSQLTLAEAYVYDDFDVEGDIHAIFPIADRLLIGRFGPRERLGLVRRLLSLPRTKRPRTGSREPFRRRARRFSREYDRQAVTYHYDLSNEFFRLMLGERMLYTCAYFASADEDLDSAQERKLELICRKLRLQEGERLLDVGCGWGALALYAAEHYGVDVHGVTLSRPQAELANERARELGVDHLVRIEARDYRELRPPKPYDKIASVCMFEHVAPHQLPDYFRRVRELLKPGGVFFNQGIARKIDFERTARRGNSFIERWVFPGCKVVPVSESLRAAELAGFEPRDLESLRDHYALTITHWNRNVERNRERIVELVGEEAYRVFRLYTAGSVYGYQQGHVSVYQALFAKPRDGVSGLPLTRADWYDELAELQPDRVGAVREEALA